MAKPRQREGESDEAFAARMERYRARYAAHNRKCQADPAFVERANKHRRDQYANDPEYRANILKKSLDRHYESRHDPEYVGRRREYYHKRAALPAGHSGVCDLCGVKPPPRRNGARGLCEDHRHDTGAVRGYICVRCNNQVAVLDLAFTDPDRFDALRAYSMRGAPPVPAPPVNKVRRRKPRPHPTLFNASNTEDTE